MTEFQAFFQIGFEHIIDKKFSGIDHILFIVVLSAIYQLAQWRKILILITAFTLGHSLTLALAVLQVVGFDKALIETLIPITILITALLNFWEQPSNQSFNQSSRLYVRYGLAVIFGFIHGFAFSNFLRDMFGNNLEGIAWRLLAFNVGIEIGQIIVVIMVLLLGSLVVKLLRLRADWWNYALSGVAAVLAVWLLLDKLGWKPEGL
ncbi:MAG: HupE/UreJ family protein [Microscillaceae bacterium]|jgi:hypothetical protein|nr:HupE/UreJ family protein [Microscillaceae bacterium]